jgi:hypothetical protein
LSRSQIRRTRRRVRKIERILNKRRIRFVKVQHQTGKRSYGCEREGGVHASAYAGRGGLRKISICPAFFGRDQTKTQAKTIIHELVHEIGFHHQLLKNQSRGAGGTGGATTTSQARQLTQENPGRARKNPTNYAELYATEFYGR